MKWIPWNGVPMSHQRDAWAEELLKEAEDLPDGAHYTLCGDTMVVLVKYRDYSTLYQCKVLASHYPEE